MSENTVEAWTCDVCGHTWLKGTTKPTHCASSKCRSRKWNVGKLTQPKAERTVELNREEGSDHYEVVYLLDGEVQGVVDYPHQGLWSQMQDDVENWTRIGFVPAAVWQ